MAYISEFSNLALHKPASQSSTRASDFASLAVDGNKNNVVVDGSCSHTNDNDIHPWWEVDLQMTAVVYKIAIMNRNVLGKPFLIV